MGARGPLPLAAHQRRVEAGKVPPTEVRLPVPRVLGAEGRAEWRRVTRMLAERQLLDDADRAVLLAYCRTWERWVELDQACERYDQPTKAGRGVAPEWRVLSDVTALLVRLATQLGLTPAARLRLPPRENEQADPILGLLRRGDRPNSS